MIKTLKKSILLLLLIGLTAVLFGCTPTKYDEAEANKIIEEGKVLIDKYLDSLPEGVVTERKHNLEVGSESGYIYAGYYLSHVVSCSFKADGVWYKVYANLEDGQLYTNYQMFDIKEQLARQLKPYCEKYGFDGEFEIYGDTNQTHIVRILISHDVPVKKSDPTDVMVVIEDVIPVEYCGENTDALADQYFKNQPLTEFNIRYTSSDDSQFDARILIDYLKDSGNFIDPSTAYIPYEINYYTINGKRILDDTLEDQVYSDVTDVIITQGIDNANVASKQIMLHRENDMEILYSGKDAYLNANELDDINWTINDFPFAITKNEIVYYATDSNYMPRLRFTSDPGFKDIKRYENPDSENPTVDALRIIPTEDGTWVLVLDNGNTFVPSWYGFSDNQRIEFN